MQDVGRTTRAPAGDGAVGAAADLPAAPGDGDGRAARRAGGTRTARPGLTVIGVDPGSRTTGIVVRRGTELLDADLVSNDEPEMNERYLVECTAAVEARRDDHPRAVLAIEDLVHPTPRLGLANVLGLLGTAQVLGALRAHAADWLAEGTIAGLVLVRPGRHGSAPLRAYPAPLVGPGEKRGGGVRRHVRSAWDVAGAAIASSYVQRLDL